jgi:hypothetical protein
MSRALLVLLASLSFSAPAAAQSSRLAFVLRGLERHPAVLLAPDRAWIPYDFTPSAVCTEVLCRPAVAVEACTPPRCPGWGSVVRASERIAEVSEWPTDYDGYSRELSALYALGELGPLVGSLSGHPSPPAPPAPRRPARFSHDQSEWWRFELAAFGGVATGLAHISQPMVHTQLELGLTFRPRGMDDEGLDLVYGSQVGAAVRARLISNVSGQSFDDLAFFLGFGPRFTYVDYDDVFRIPPLFAWVIPEFGFVVRTDGLVDPAWYAAWSLPLGVLIDEHLGLEARTSLLVIDDWYPGEDAEVLITLDVGVFVR